TARRIRARQRAISTLPVHHHRRCLDALEVERTGERSRAPQTLRSLILKPDLLAELRPPGDCFRGRRLILEPHADRIVGELRSIVDERAENHGIDECTLDGDVELDHYREPILALVQ